MNRFTSFDGALYLGNALRPVRPVFSHHFPRIETGAQLRATLRAGPYTWPGGYPVFFYFYDGEGCCFACARREIRSITRAIRDKSRDDWRIVGCEINYEDSSLYCAHCNARIESAYAED